MHSESYPGWENVASRKRASLKELLEPFLPPNFQKDAVPPPQDLRDCTEFVRQALGGEERRITDLVQEGIAPLLEELATGRLKAADAVYAFVQRAAMAHLLVSLVLMTVARSEVQSGF